MAVERTRRAEQYRDAITHLSRVALQAGDLATAIHWSREIVRLDPMDGEATLTLMEVLASGGHAIDAVRCAKVYGSMFVDDVDIQPDPRVSALAAKLRLSAGDAPTPESTVATHAANTSSGHQAALPSPDTPARTPSATHDAPGSRRSTLRVGATIGVALMLAVVLWVVRGASSSNEARRPSRIESAGTFVSKTSPRFLRVALLPLQGATQDSTALLVAEGVTREMISVLSSAGVSVIGYGSVARYAKQQLPLREMARALGADAVGIGRVLQARGKVEIQLRLVDVASGKEAWEHSTTLDSAGISGVSREAAWGLATWINGGERNLRSGRMPMTPSTTPEAYTSYLVEIGRASCRERV